MPSQTFCPTSPNGYRLVEDLQDYEVELGHKFSSFYRSTIDGSSSTSIVAITTSTTKCYAYFSVESDKSGMYELYEDAEISSGSMLTVFNNNRNSIVAASVVVVGDPNVTTVGTFIGSHVIGSSTGGASKSGGSSNVNTYQLKYNSTYLLMFTADTATTRVTHGVYWRESE